MHRRDQETGVQKIQQRAAVEAGGCTLWQRKTHPAGTRNITEKVQLHVAGVAGVMLAKGGSRVKEERDKKAVAAAAA